MANANARCQNNSIIQSGLGPGPMGTETEAVAPWNAGD